MKEGQNGVSDRIQLMFDIEEGEQKDFFRKQYESQTSEDKKWKGTVAIYVPTDDGSEKDGWTKKSFKTIMENFEASNPGYTWNWDENSLKGKLIGGIFVDTYSVIDGKEVKFVSLVAKIFVLLIVSEAEITKCRKQSIKMVQLVMFQTATIQAIVL